MPTSRKPAKATTKTTTKAKTGGAKVPVGVSKAVAYANDEIALVAWRYGRKIPGCLGFALTRIDQADGTRELLPAWVPFSGQVNADWKAGTTAEWPVQKFHWADFTAKRGRTYAYEIVPMVGAPGKLKPLSAQALTTAPVTLTPRRGAVSTYFNRAILSTQSLVHALPQHQGKPDFASLAKAIAVPHDPFRLRLGGDLLDGLRSLLDRARTAGGDVYLALYELTDPELLALLVGNKRAHLVLSNTGADDAEDKPARQKLHASGVEIHDRMLGSGHIGHNKFAVYVDARGKPQAVLTGSTNWTAAAICGQSNNALLIESPDLAAAYRDYWQALVKDGHAQGPAFRAENAKPHQTTLDGGRSLATLWFSPNTQAHDKEKGASLDAPPNDLRQVFDLVYNAKQAVLFLAFEPGTPSLIDAIAKAQNAKPDLFVRGAVTDPKAVGQYGTDLYHRSGAAPDAHVVAASAIEGDYASWHKELLKLSPASHAIIHDKIIVIDPFSDDCVVITGSHNLGYKASYANDENLLVIRGDRAVAQAYAAHVMDVYGHYRFRYTIQQNAKAAGSRDKHAWTGLDKTDAWQDRYFDPKSDAAKEIAFWTAG